MSLQTGCDRVPVQMVGKIGLQDTQQWFHGCADPGSLDGWGGVSGRANICCKCVKPSVPRNVTKEASAGGTCTVWVAVLLKIKAMTRSG